MSLRVDFFNALRFVIGDEPGLALIHSSLASLAPSSQLEKWDALYAIKKLVQSGWTLAFPSFTFSFTQTGVYSPSETPSEVGILADWVQNNIVGALRTDHPIYSFVVVGNRAAEFSACPSKTTFGDTSPFGFLERENAKIVMLGTDWRFCTSFHRFEELHSVPYRFFKTFSGIRHSQENEEPVEVSMYVRDLDINARNNFNVLVDTLRERNEVNSANLWRGKIEVASMHAIRDAANSLLENDKFAFVADRAIAQYRHLNRVEAKRLEPFRVAVVGDSNLDVIAHELKNDLRSFMPDRECLVFSSPFGQLAQSILIPTSELYDFNAELTIFANRLESLAKAANISYVDPDLLLECVARYAGLILKFSSENGGDVVVHNFSFSSKTSVGNMSALKELIDRCNDLLNQELSQLKNIIWIDTASIIANVDEAFDNRLWHIGRIPFAKPYSAALAQKWAGIVLSLLGKTSRLLILDLDNTLWGGVLGEDGPEGVALGGDFPGNAFSEFQQTINTISEGGVALAVCSKNDENIAISMLQNSDNMLIRVDDLVAHRINWDPKWQNIQEIAKELDLGLASIMFIDDNPVEREAVKLNLPAVKVLDLPDDVTQYSDALISSPFIQNARIGKEDLKRVASYKARRELNIKRSSAASMEDFLTGLGMTLHIQPLNDDNTVRAAQLCQKTNQFNTTTKRYTARDLREMVSTGNDVVVIGLEDKFTAKENIGLIVLKQDETYDAVGHIDLFLLSCRVLGRTVEQAVIGWALKRGAHLGWEELIGQVIETPRNTPARSVFKECGFLPSTNDGKSQAKTGQQTIPKWFDICDTFSK